MHKHLWHLLSLTIAAAAAFLTHTTLTTTATVDDTAKSAHLFEQRVYTAAEGQLPALHARFRNHTNHLFVKHGMKLVGYWTPTETPNTLIYILAHADKASAEASWKSFMADEEWQAAWAASKEKAGGPLVTKIESTFMTPTDYSPLR